MRCSFVIFFLALFMVTILCGCSLLIKPSDQTRHASYAKIKNQFVADREAALRQTYVVFSGDSELKISMTKDTVVTFTNNKTMNRGLAVGLDSDGYLLTAGHIVEGKTFVLGWFDGKFDLRPARLVFRNDFKIPADVALLKVEGKLDHCAIFGEKPKIGERVAEVVCYHKATEIGGMIDFIGGTVIQIADGPTGSSVALVETDLPAWRGDSGGPLLSSSGELVGIFTKYQYRWFGHPPKYRTTCYFPDKEFIQSIIARDRASIKWPNKSPEPTAVGAVSSADAAYVAGRRWFSFLRQTANLA